VLMRRVVPVLLLAIVSLTSAVADLDPQRGLGARPPTPEEKARHDAICTKVTYVAPNAIALQRVAAEARAGRSPKPAGRFALPTAVDNSTSQYFPPIRSQGGQGSCTCWAACYYYDTYTQAMDEGYNVSGGDNDHICSPAFMYNIINEGMDEGAYTGEAVSRLNTIGCSSWTLKPYDDSDYTSWPSEQAWVQALRNRTQLAYEIDGSSQAGLDSMKQYLANGNLLVTDFSVYATWYSHYPDDRTGINNGVYYCPDGSNVGGHAVTLVGYDDTKSYTDHRDGQVHHGAFLVANSWGSGWGLYNSTGVGSKGFFWVAYTMFLESTFGPWAYYNSDRPDYRPSFYAAVGINAAERDCVRLIAACCSPVYPEPVIYFDGGALPLTDASRIAVDLSDGVLPDLKPSRASINACRPCYASTEATITSADFYEDYNGDGSYRLHSSLDPPIAVPLGDYCTAYATIQTGSDSAGLYDGASSTFYLRNAKTPGAADLTFRFGPAGAGWLPIAGDYDSDGDNTIGLYSPSTATFYLHNTNAAGIADITFHFGPAPNNWTPIAGDWNGDGLTTFGLYDSATGIFYLRNLNAPGPADLTFRFGPAASSWLPIAGDWNGDNVATIGLYNPATGTFYLRNTNTAGLADLTFRYGPASGSWKPLAGDWNDDEVASVGLYDATGGTLYLRNTNTPGAADLTFRFGPKPSTWTAIGGDWDGL